MVTRLSADMTFDGEQGRDLVESLEGDRRRRLVVHVVEVAPGMAPAGDFDKRGITERGCRLIEPSEPTIAAGMQEPAAGAEQRLHVNAFSVCQVAVECRRRYIRSPRRSSRTATHRQPFLVLPRPGDSTGTVVLSAWRATPARTWRPMASARGVSRNKACPTQSASVDQSSSTPWRRLIPAWRCSGIWSQNFDTTTWVISPGPGRPRSIGSAGIGAWRWSRRTCSSAWGEDAE